MFKVVKQNVSTDIHTISEVDETNIFAFSIDEISIYKLAKVKYDKWAWVTVNKVGTYGDHYFSSDLYDSKKKAIEFAVDWLEDNYQKTLNEFSNSKEFFEWCLNEFSNSKEFFEWCLKELK